MKKLHQDGFGHVVTAAVVVLVFSAIGYIGYKLYAHPAPVDDTATVITEANRASDVPTAPAVKTSADLDKATMALDAVDPSASNKTDEATLNSQLSSF